jgi:alcohol dehydrogenase
VHIPITLYRSKPFGFGHKETLNGRGDDIAEEVLRLGAHIYIDTHREDTAARLRELGGARAILSTVGQQVDVVSAVMAGLNPQGHLVLLDADKTPVALSTGHLVAGERSVIGSLTGSPYENERALNFSLLAGVRPMVEVIPLEKANEAYHEMKSDKVKFRMVITMENLA